MECLAPQLAFGLQIEMVKLTFVHMVFELSLHNLNAAAKYLPSLNIEPWIEKRMQNLYLQGTTSDLLRMAYAH